MRKLIPKGQKGLLTNIIRRVLPLRYRITHDIYAAKKYKESDQYRQLVQQFINETGDSSIPIESFYRKRKPFPEIVLESRPKNHVGGYNYITNSISIDPSQSGDETPFHEGLHWQNIGEYDIDKGPLYEDWANASLSKAPWAERQLLWDRFYDVPSNRDILQQEELIDNLYKKKVDDVLEGVENNAEMRKRYELLAHTFGVGHALGLKPFQKYPGYNKAQKVIQKAQWMDGFLYDIKAGTEDEVKNFWKLLTGNYMPVTIASMSAIGAKELNNNNNNKTK